MTPLSQHILFREVQTLPRWLAVLPLSPLVILWPLILSDEPTLLGVLIPSFIFCGTALPLVFSKLTTEVRDDGFYARFSPFHLNFQRFEFADIASATARDYSAIGEYGGWGIRYGLGGVGKAYNARGNQGVQLVFKDGQKLLIGSQRAEQLSYTINRQLFR
jgi:hypothetical protein